MSILQLFMRVDKEAKQLHVTELSPILGPEIKYKFLLSELNKKVSEL